MENLNSHRILLLLTSGIVLLGISLIMAGQL